MLEVLQFIFESPWRFLGACIFLGILSLWKPVEINTLNGYWKGDRHEDQT